MKMRELIEAAEKAKKPMKFAVTMSETGNAEIVTAKDHKAALKKVNPMMRYAEGDADQVSAIKKSTFEAARRSDELFLREYSRPGSADYPTWDEDAGPLMVWHSDEVDEDVYVYPVAK